MVLKVCIFRKLNRLMLHESFFLQFIDTFMCLILEKHEYDLIETVFKQY